MTLGIPQDMRRMAFFSLSGHLIILVLLTAVPLLKMPAREASSYNVMLISQPAPSPREARTAPVSPVAKQPVKAPPPPPIAKAPASVTPPPAKPVASPAQPPIVFPNSRERLTDSFTTFWTRGWSERLGTEFGVGYEFRRVNAALFRVRGAIGLTPSVDLWCGADANVNGNYAVGLGVSYHLGETGRHDILHNIGGTGREALSADRGDGFTSGQILRRDAVRGNPVLRAPCSRPCSA